MFYLLNSLLKPRNFPYTNTLGNIRKMKLRLIFSHILITIISNIGLSVIWVSIGNGVYETIYLIFHLMIIFGLYSYSGFLYTDLNKKIKFLNYSIIGIVGLIFWIVCYIESSDSLWNYQNSDGGIWFLYTLFVSGINEPINLIFDNFNSSIINQKLSMFLLLIMTIIPSILQYFGGKFKNKTLPNTVYN